MNTVTRNIKLAALCCAVAILGGCASAPPDGEVVPIKTVAAQDKADYLKDLPSPLTAEWLSENYEKYHELAKNKPSNPDGSPSKELHTFLYIQRAVLDLANNNSKTQVNQTSMDSDLHAEL